MSFLVIYLFFTFIINPIIAPIFGREAIKHTEKISPANYITVLLNRNYVRPELNKVLKNMEMGLSNTPIKIYYLDANFPFINRFPLLPHLSHNDGKKLDLSFVYEDSNGKISSLLKSRSGYGSFSAPKKEEYNQIDQCINSGYFQYNYPKYLTFGLINQDLDFSTEGTKKLLKLILNQPAISKVFIEPHLVNRMNIQHEKIRYHGCRAVRHDDHIHIQIH